MCVCMLDLIDLLKIVNYVVLSRNIIRIPAEYCDLVLYARNFGNNPSARGTFAIISINSEMSDRRLRRDRNAPAYATNCEQCVNLVSGAYYVI